MIPYVLGIIFAIGGGWIGIKAKNKKMAMILTFLPLFFLAAFRVNIGTDYKNYISIFYGLQYDNPMMYGWIKPDPLFLVLNNTIAALNLSPQWIFIVTSAIYCGCLVYVIYDLSSYQLMSVFLLFGTTIYFASLNEVNQHFACCVLMVSLIFAYKKKFLPFIILVVIAGLIHSMSFLFLVVYIFNFKCINRRNACIIAGASVVALPFVIKIVQVIIKLTPYAHYLTYDKYLGASSLVGILLQFAILAFTSLYYDKNDSLYKFLYSVNVVCLVITLLQGYIPLAYRIKWIFYYPVIILIPMAIRNIKDRRIAFLFKLILIVLFSIYAYYQIVIGGGHGVYPYEGLLWM